MLGWVPAVKEAQIQQFGLDLTALKGGVCFYLMLMTGPWPISDYPAALDFVFVLHFAIRHSYMLYCLHDHGRGA